MDFQLAATIFQVTTLQLWHPAHVEQLDMQPSIGQSIVVLREKERKGERREKRDKRDKRDKKEKKEKKKGKKGKKLET